MAPPHTHSRSHALTHTHTLILSIQQLSLTRNIYMTNILSDWHNPRKLVVLHTSPPFTHNTLLLCLPHHHLSLTSSCTPSYKSTPVFTQNSNTKTLSLTPEWGVKWWWYILLSPLVLALPLILPCVALQPWALSPPSSSTCAYHISLLHCNTCTHYTQ